MFRIAAGSVIGNYHLKTNKNNQDAFAVVKNDDMVVVAVCDGCGSCPNSEVGAQLGAQFLVDEISHFRRLINWEPENNELFKYPPKLDFELYCMLEILVNRITKSIGQVAHLVGGEFTEAINNYFLFTSVIAVIGTKYSFVASIGDGFISINGRGAEIGPYPNNAPPYVGYSLIPEHVTMDPALLKFEVREALPTEEVNSILIATDGLSDIEASADKNLPGKKESVGPVSQFWENDLFFKNPVALERRLRQIGRNYSKVFDGRLVRENGYLRDDTTIVAIRRENDERVPG